MSPRLIFFVFIAGVTVGVAAMWVFLGGPSDSVQTVDHPLPAPRVSMSSERAPDNAAAETPASAAPTTTDKIEPTSTPPAAVVPAVADQAGTTADDASIQHIDVGPAFSKQIAQPSIPGFENQLGDAHRALERETRDDGWAYAMEAEIQNSMVNEVSTGAFRLEHIECRATMCEVRLSGKADQTAAIKHWNEGLGAQPFGKRLFPNYSSSISNDERVDSLLIFQRPPPSPAPPR